MYQAPDLALWQGRIDKDPSGRALRWHQCIFPLAQGYQPPGVVVLGICCDEGVRRNLGRPGARHGPDAIRKAMANQAFHLERPLYDGGNLLCERDDLEALALEQAMIVEKLLEQGHFPLVLGGGHEIAYGSFLGLTQYLDQAGEQPTLGILNFDAHFDLRQTPLASSGTPFAQIAHRCGEQGRAFRYFCLGISEVANTAALFERARSLDVGFIKDEELTGWNMESAEAELEGFLAQCDAIYLSIDLDVLPEAVAPGVSAPAPRGLTLEVVEHLIGFIRSRAGERLKLADIAEYNPELDISERTARVAARLAHLLVR